MARYEKTLSNLKQMAALMPVAAAAGRAASADRSDSLVKQLIAILTKEDSNAVKIALLCRKLMNKYPGRAV